MHIKISVGGAPCRELRRVYLKGSARLHLGQLHALWQSAVQETGVHPYLLINNHVHVALIAVYLLYFYSKPKLLIINSTFSC